MDTVEDKMISDAELDEIEARANSATVGPWFVWKNMGDYGDLLAITHEVKVTHGVNGKPLKRPRIENRDLDSEADFEFLSHTREDIPRLIAEIRRLRALSDSQS